MLRHALLILLSVTVLLGLALLGLWRLGWWPPPPSAQAQAPVAAPRTPVPVQPPLPTTPVPTVSADPISLPPPASPSPPLPQTRPTLRPAPEAPVATVEVRPPPSQSAQPAQSAQPPVPPVSRPQGSGQALAPLNAVRALAGQPAVTPEPAWQAECDAHATYLTVTDTGSHSEDPASPHYSSLGAQCAHGHYYVTMRPEATGEQAMTYWQNGPFHLPQLIDPRLTRAAFAVKHDASGDLHTAAVLDVKRGRDGPAKYPVKFPRPGSQVTPQVLSRFEYPDALPGCPGYTHPAGAPIALLLGQGQRTRQADLRINGQPAAVCLLTAQTFTGATENDTRVGRSVLEAQGVAVAVPRRPLPPAAKIDIHFQTEAGPVSWTFHTR